MMKSFKTSINEFDATFKLEGENLLIELQCMKKKEILLARYTQDSIPQTLHNLVDTPDDLYELLENISKEDLRVSKEKALVMSISIIKKKREYILPLEKAELSVEDKLRFEIQFLKKQLDRERTSIIWEYEEKLNILIEELERQRIQKQQLILELQQLKKQIEKNQHSYYQYPNCYHSGKREQPVVPKRENQRVSGYVTGIYVTESTGGSGIYVGGSGRYDTGGSVGYVTGGSGVRG